jgi:ABC-type sugar transport system permease subunit
MKRGNRVSNGVARRGLGSLRRGGVSYQVKAYAFLLPALLLLGTFAVYPVISLFRLSFTDYQLLAEKINFVGLQNYRKVFKDPLFLKTIVNILYFTLVDGVIQAVLGLFCAVCFTYAMRGIKWFRAIMYFPAVTSFVSVCIIWKLMYNGQFGLVGRFFSSVFRINTGFLANSATAMNAVIVACSWKSFGWYMAMFLAGLTQIPGSLYESAYIDGVTFWKKLFYITLPMLKNTLVFVFALEIIDAMKVYIPAFIMTSGGPAQSTATPVYNIWIQAFKVMNVSYASAMAVIYFVLIMLVTGIQFRGMRADKGVE